MNTKKKSTSSETKSSNENEISNYKSSLEYLYWIFNSEKARYDNFNIRSNWMLVFLGVLIVAVKFFWIDSIQCTAKSILSFILFVLSSVLLVVDAILCLYSMIPKTKFETTKLDSFMGDKFTRFLSNEETTFYKTLIEQIAPKANLYYIENERKSKIIKTIYAIASLIVIIDFILLILKIC